MVPSFPDTVDQSGESVRVFLHMQQDEDHDTHFSCEGKSEG